MTLIQLTVAQAIAADIQTILEEIKDFNVAALKRVYDLVNTPGRQQAVLEVFGENGASAFQAYVALQMVMEQLAPGKVPVGNPEIFVPQEDGRLVFVELPDNSG